MGEVIKRFPKEKFLELVSDGLFDHEALARINQDLPERQQFQKATFIQLMVKDAEFKDAVEQAKRVRADKWFEDIGKSVSNVLTKEEVPAEKLKFEQRKYLAAIDNPDKYAEKRKTELDVNVNIFQEMKELPQAEARKLLQSVDPFNTPIEAEFSTPQPSTSTSDDDINSSEDIFS
jgi:hypothetical protein